MKQARFFFLNRFYWPDVAATSQMLTDLAEDVAAQGRATWVVASANSYGTATERLAAHETHNGVNILRVRGTRFGRFRVWGRIADSLTFMVGAFARLLRARRGDVIVCMSDPPIAVGLGWLVARLRGARLVYWVQDLYPDIAVELGALKRNSWLHDLLVAIARRLHDACDAVVALGPAMAEHLVTSGARPQVTGFIHNWADTAAIKPISAARNGFLDAHGLRDKFVVQYSGNAGRAHTFDAVIEAMELLRDDTEIVFAFIGGGAQYPELQRRVAERALGNAIFLEYVARSDLRYSLSAASVALVTERPAMVGLLVPSKTYGILASGRPLIFIGAQNSDVAAVVRHAAAGYVIAPEDGAGLARTIAYLKQNPQHAAVLGASARSAAEGVYGRHRATALWLTFVETTLGIVPRASQKDSPEPHSLVVNA